MKTIHLKNLETLACNQEACKDKAPITTIAAFKIQDLEELISTIKERRGKEAGPLTYNLCITFVREKTDENGNFDNKHLQIRGGNPSMAKIAKESNIRFTQIIPIITGCVVELVYNENEKEYQTKNFRYLDNGEEGKTIIPFVAPGGEGSGLIPPPPPEGKD